MTAPPRPGHIVDPRLAHGIAPDDDVTVGEQAGAAYGAQLDADDRSIHSLDAQRQAAELVATEATHETNIPPIIREIPQANANFYAETFTLQPGEVAMILPRDDWRELAEIVNQSAAGGAKVALCATKRDADNGSTAGHFPPARGAQVVPGGSVPRKATHVAPVWAVCDPAAAAAAVVDVIVERRATPRP